MRGRCDRHPGTIELALPIERWDPASGERPNAGVVGVAAPERLEAPELRLSLTVTERVGSARKTSPQQGDLVTEDFRLAAVVTGAIGTGVAGGGGERFFSLQLAQTAADYDTLYDGCL